MGDNSLDLTQLVSRYNWKSAILSSIPRSAIFFGFNTDHGLSIGIKAAAVEFGVRLFLAGVYGGITETFKHKHGLGNYIKAGLLLSAVTATFETAFHYMGGTPDVLWPVTASATITLFSTQINLYCYKQGILNVTGKRNSLLTDLKLLPQTYAGMFKDIYQGLRFLYQPDNEEANKASS